MSYFLFGSFHATQDKHCLEDVKSYGKQNDVYVWFDDEITFYREIATMCAEQHSCGTVRFALTSFRQKYNSSDLLFPYDKYTNDEFFQDQSRVSFCRCCRSNLDIVWDCLRKLMELAAPSCLEIFVVEGYDDVFQRKPCTFDEMKEDLLAQIETGFVDSSIYQIHP